MVRRSSGNLRSARTAARHSRSSTFTSAKDSSSCFITWSTRTSSRHAWVTMAQSSSSQPSTSAGSSSSKLAKRLVTIFAPTFFGAAASTTCDSLGSSSCDHGPEKGRRRRTRCANTSPPKWLSAGRSSHASIARVAPRIWPRTAWRLSGPPPFMQAQPGRVIRKPFPSGACTRPVGVTPSHRACCSSTAREGVPAGAAPPAENGGNLAAAAISSKSLRDAASVEHTPQRPTVQNMQGTSDCAVPLHSKSAWRCGWSAGRNLHLGTSSSTSPGCSSHRMPAWCAARVS